MRATAMNVSDLRPLTGQGVVLLVSAIIIASAGFIGIVVAKQTLDTIFIASAMVFTIYVVWQSRRAVQRLMISEAKAKRVAGHDILSGLPNRFLFNELIDTEISRCGRGISAFALFYLDLDRFKEINDTLGHDAGDRLIVQISDRITCTLRTSDHLARLGGDEFGIIQTDVTDPAESAALAQRILDCLTEPFDLGGGQIFATISIGIAFCPQDAMDRNTLMCRADLALYRSKHAGRNRFSFFEPCMDEQVRRRKAVEDELRQAILHDRLGLEYQPVMYGDGRAMKGVEALVRWNHPTQGTLQPEAFVALAEERGLIVQLGEWVLRRACLEARSWPNLRVAVNVSPIQFRQKDFVQSVVGILKETGMDPNRLELELTEGIVIEDADLAESSIIALRSIGVRMVLDDFGTGYSSLIYLRRFAFDKIKIDRSFLQHMEPSSESAIIVESIVQLGRALGLTVNAEGVETEEHVRFLGELGCDELQGFYFDHSLTAEEITRRTAETKDPKPDPTIKLAAVG